MEDEKAASTNAIQSPLIDEFTRIGFSQQTIEALIPAIESSKLVHYTSGETIYYAGEGVEALYLIRDGRIKLVNYLDNGRARIVRMYNRGSILGLNGLLEENYTHDAITIDDMSLFHIPMQSIQAVKQSSPDAYNQLLECLQEDLRLADTWITDFSTGAIRGRVARLLVFLMGNDIETGPGKVTLLTVEEMADIIGVTPESVSRIMAEMKRKHILKESEDDLVNCYQCDLDRLRKEASK